MGERVLAPVGGWDNHIVPMLDHACCEPRRECLGGRVEVAQHCITMPPTHEAHHVSVKWAMRRTMSPPA